MTSKFLIGVFASVLPLVGWSLEPLQDEELSEFTGQNGVYLSGDIAINELGGPLSSGDPLNVDPNDGSVVWGTCEEVSLGNAQRCGGRIAVRTNDTEGYFVLDEMHGKMSFEGLTLKAREITAAGDAENFNGDEVALDGKTVLEIGLPNEVRFENFEFTIANSSTERPTDAGYTQQNIFGVELNGAIEMQGNLLVFPSGTP